MQKSENNTINQPVENVARIYEKLQQLLKQYDGLQKENDRNKKNLDAIHKKMEAYEENISQMQQQNLVLKASVSAMADADKKDLEQKINSYVRSIDKCISLLSK